MKYQAIFLLVIFGIISCTSNDKRQDAITKVKMVEDSLYSKKEMFQINSKEVQNVISAYDEFATAFPGDSMTPEYLLKKADLLRYSKENNKALVLYQQIYVNYPNFSKRAHCLFLQGFIYENDMNRLEKAKEKYELFLKNYPKHDLADDVQFSLNNLGKTPEEIIRQFEEQNPDTTASEAVSEES